MSKTQKQKVIVLSVLIVFLLVKSMCGTVEMSSEESFYLLRHRIKVNVIETGSRRQAWHGAHLKEMYNSVYKKKETF